MRALAIIIAVGLGLAAVPAFAGDQYQHTTLIGFLTEHGVQAQLSPRIEPAACKAEGGTCTADTDCCTGACKPAGEARVCVPK